MIRLRYPVALAALAAAMALLAFLTTVIGAQLALTGNDLMPNTSGPLDDDDLQPLYAVWTLQEAVMRVPAWAVLAAAIPAIGALVLLVLRARAQAGSASATASRDASTASSRS